MVGREPLDGYIVGGYVREWLLGRASKDLDLAVDGPAIPLARRIADRIGGAFYVLDEQTDAARVVYRGVPGLTVDFAALRGGDITADLQARDLTINALAINVRDYDQSQPDIIDPCGGQADLEAQLVRATHGSAFQRDPLRLLRALRLAAALGFRIEPQTWAWIRRDAPLIRDASAERIRQEVSLILAAADAADHLRSMEELGLMRYVLPELTALKGVHQPPPHIHDAYEHTLLTVAEAERLSAFPDAQLGPDEARFLGPFAEELAAHFRQPLCEQRRRSTLLKFGAVLHDVGKRMPSASGGNGRIDCAEHDRIGAAIAHEVLTRLRFSSGEIRLLVSMVRHHMRPGWLLKHAPVTGTAVYRFFRDTGSAGIDVLILALADQLATRGDTLQRGHWRHYLGLTQNMLDHYFRKPREAVSPPKLVTGRDVMDALGLGPGPKVGRLLEAVREAQAEGRVRTREQALDFLAKLPL
jgi:tRNA nucleotidyltransferase/poly(A) polymerase